MAHSRSALKRVRQAQVRRERNRATISAVRTAIRRFREAVASKDQELSGQAFRKAVRTIDRAAARGYIHKNAAARRKSRLSLAMRTLTQKDQA
ncbi:MAG: 30S ribosomal protein S20 [Bacillota bacterium]